RQVAVGLARRSDHRRVVLGKVHDETERAQEFRRSDARAPRDGRGLVLHRIAERAVVRAHRVAQRAGAREFRPCGSHQASIVEGNAFSAAPSAAVKIGSGTDRTFNPDCASSASSTPGKYSTTPPQMTTGSSKPPISMMRSAIECMQ